MEIKPILHRFDRPRILVFGKYMGDQIVDWNLNGLNSNADLAANPELVSRLTSTCNLSGVATIFVPDSSLSNKQIVLAPDFKMEMHPNSLRYIMRGPKADGMVLPQWTGFVGTPADCPFIIAYRESDLKVVVVHAGRESLIDRDAIKTGLNLYMWRSVVRNILKEFRDKSLTELHFFITCHIGPESFLHPIDHPDPEIAKANCQMIDYICQHFGQSCFWGPIKEGRLNLQALIIRQLKIFGEIDRAQISADGLDTFSFKDSNGRHALHSHVRSLGTPDDQMRNLLIVANIP